MPDPARRENVQQFTAVAADSALTVARENIIRPSNLAGDKARTVPREEAIHERFDRDELYMRPGPDDAQADENQSGKSKREPSFLARLLQCTGTVVGFLMGGSAGAALGSVIGELAGDITTEQTNLIFRRVLKWDTTTVRHPDSCRVESDEAADGNSITSGSKHAFIKSRLQ
jgi:hypothetical protein